MRENVRTDNKVYKRFSIKNLSMISTQLKEEEKMSCTKQLNG